VISNDQNPRDVVQWFLERVEPGIWRRDVIEFVLYQALEGATLESMEHFLEINARSRRNPALGIFVTGGV